MTMTRRSAIGLFALAPVVSFVALPAQAAEPETFQINGLAIRGYDPVAYFTQGGPILGSGDFTTSHNGATWQFVNDTNKAAFIADPAKYGAQFGGYCAFAASKGYLAPTIPEAWTVYNDRLYLNANLRARELWLQDVPGNIAKGEANWPGILG